MPTKSVTKEEMLTKSFGVLKEDTLENISELQSIIAQMLAVNPELALKMWQHLVLENYDDFKADKTQNGINYNLSADMLDLLTNEDAFLGIESSFVSNKQLTSIIFGESVHITEAMLWVITHLIQLKRLQEANHLISLIYQNRAVTTIDFEEYSFYKVITGIIDRMLEDRKYGNNFFERHHTKEFDDNTQDLIHIWIEKLDEEKEIAKANVAFAKICRF